MGDSRHDSGGERSRFSTYGPGGVRAVGSRTVAVEGGTSLELLRLETAAPALTGGGAIFARRGEGWWVFRNGVEVHAPPEEGGTEAEICRLLLVGGRSYRYRGEAREQPDGSLLLRQHGGEEIIQIIHPTGGTTIEREFALYERGNVFPLAATEPFRVVRLRVERPRGGPARLQAWWGTYRADEARRSIVFEPEKEAGQPVIAAWEDGAFIATGVRRYPLPEGGELLLELGQFPVRPHLPPSLLDH